MRQHPPGSHRIVLAIIVALVIAGPLLVPLPTIRLLGAPPEVAAAQRSPTGQARRPRARIIVREGCRIRAQGRDWRLQANCTPTGTIRLPKGTRFNGQHRRMLVTGNLRKFDHAVLSVTGGRSIIQNLTIEGRSIHGSCGGLVGIRFSGAGGAIRNVTIDGLRGRTPLTDENGDPCVLGIWITGHPRSPTVAIVNTRISNIDGAGIRTGDLKAITLDRVHLDLRTPRGALPTSAVAINNVDNVIVNRSTFRLVPTQYGVIVSRGSRVRLGGNSFTGSGAPPGSPPFTIHAVGVSARDTAITANTITGAQIGVHLSSAVATLNGNQISAETGVVAVSTALTLIGNAISAPPGGDNPDGAVFGTGSSGTVSANTISGYRCGIELGTDHGPVTILPNNNLQDNVAEVCEGTTP